MIADMPENLLKRVCEIAEGAGARILDIYRNESIDVSHKGDDSPLTQADMAAHRYICEQLKALTPDVPVLSEESAKVSFAERQTWHRYWLVDPLDGTREFIKRNDEFTVNIALIENDVSVLGVVQVPVDGRCFGAVRGEGAMLWQNGQQRELKTRAAPATGIVVAGSRSHAGGEQAEFLARLGEHELKPLGSSLKFCEIAAGSADLYLRLGPTSEWDTAAAQCVLEAAGGAVLRLDGKPLVYNSKDSLLNPEFLAVGDTGTDWIGQMQLDQRQA